MSEHEYEVNLSICVSKLEVLEKKIDRSRTSSARKTRDQNSCAIKVGWTHVIVTSDFYASEKVTHRDEIQIQHPNQNKAKTIVICL